MQYPLRLNLIKELAYSCLQSPNQADSLIVNYLKDHETNQLSDLFELLTDSLALHISMTLSKRDELIAHECPLSDIEALNTELYRLYDIVGQLFAVLPVYCHLCYLQKFDLSQMSSALASSNIWAAFFQYHDFNDADILYAHLIVPNFVTLTSILPALIDGLSSSKLEQEDKERFFSCHIAPHINLLSSENLIDLLDKQYITSHPAISSSLVTAFIRNNISNVVPLYRQLYQLIGNQEISCAVFFIETLRNQYASQLSSAIHSINLAEVLHHLIVKSKNEAISYETHNSDNVLPMMEPIILAILKCEPVVELIVTNPIIPQYYYRDCIAQVFSWACDNKNPNVLGRVLDILGRFNSLEPLILSQGFPQYKTTAHLETILTTPSLAQYSGVILDVFREAFYRPSVMKTLYCSYEAILKNHPTTACRIREFFYQTNFKGLDYFIQNPSILSEKTLLHLFEPYDKNNEQHRNSLILELSKKATHVVNSRRPLMNLGYDLVSTTDMHITLILNLLFTPAELNEIFAATAYANLAMIYQQGQDCLMKKHAMHYKSAPLRLLQDWMEQKNIIHEYPTVQCEKLIVFREPYDRLIRQRQEAIFAAQSRNIRPAPNENAVTPKKMP